VVAGSKQAVMTADAQAHDVEERLALRRSSHSSASFTSCSTAASNSRRNLIYDKVPEQPPVRDAEQWSRFLASYQSGDWESRETEKKGCSSGAQKVLTKDGDVVGNLGMSAPCKCTGSSIC
jgi:hypothetical protein